MNGKKRQRVKKATLKSQKVANDDGLNGEPAARTAAEAATKGEDGNDQQVDQAALEGH
jgi:hypothetical protein